MIFKCEIGDWTFEADIEPYDPGQCSGPVEACYPPEGGTADIYSAVLDGKSMDLRGRRMAEFEEQVYQAWEESQR